MRTILLVEDSPQDVELAMEIFAHEIQDVRVQVARDGQEAIELIEKARPNEAPCLVLMDIKMPRMGGKQALERLKSSRATSMVPVGMFSSSKENSDIVSCYELGANGYVVKPYDPVEYLNTLCSIGKFWLQANAYAPMEVALHN